jgi:uncharacterized protein (DUF952 family)
MREKVYKVCTAAEWDEAVRLGYYAGSADDLRDGFIHLSRNAQIARTLARHFSEQDGTGRPNLILVSIDVASLGNALKWEPARDGSLFPHLYGPLDTVHAERIVPLPVGPDGRHLIPGDL